MVEWARLGTIGRMAFNPRRYKSRHGQGSEPVVPQRPRTPTLPGDDLTADVTMTGTLDSVTTGFNPAPGSESYRTDDDGGRTSRPDRLRTPRRVSVKGRVTEEEPIRESAPPKRKPAPKESDTDAEQAATGAADTTQSDAEQAATEQSDTDTATGQADSEQADTGAADTATTIEQSDTGTAQVAEEDKSAARSSLVMFLGTLTSRILGMIKSPFLMGAVVALNSPVAGSWDVANKLPNLLYMVIAGGLVNAVLVPAIVRASKESNDDGSKFINKLLTLTMVALGAITILLMVLAPVIVKLYASTMTQEWYSLTVFFAYWSFPQVFFYGLYTVFGQILNARENFGPYMWAPALNNVVAIAGLVIMLAVWGPESAANPSPASDWYGLRGATLAGFSTLGIAAQALILIIPLRKAGIHFRPDFKWRGSGLGRAGKASMWVLATMLVGMIPTMVQTNVMAGATQRAQQLGMELTEVASNSAYTAAYAIYSLPTSLITVSITTAMFTRLARAAAEKNYEKLRLDTSKTLRSVSTLNLLAAAGIIVLALPISRVISPFVTEAEIRSLAAVLVAMTLGLGGVGIVTVLNKVYYALEDTKGAFLIGLPWQIMGIVGFAACGLLPPDKVVVGVGLVMSASNILAALVMYEVLRRRLGGLDERRVVSTHAKLLVATGVATAVGLLWIRLLGIDRMAASFGYSVLSILVVGVIVVASYIIMLKLMRMPEAEHLTGPIKSAMQRVRNKL